jgi:hypothetical protein
MRGKRCATGGSAGGATSGAEGGKAQPANKPVRTARLQALQARYPMVFVDLLRMIRIVYII